MVELAEDMTTLPSDEQFLFGLDCLIEGVLRQTGD